MEKRRIGIIGAGISGLLACKYALSKGYQPLVFESRNTIGGVWTKTMSITKLQTPKSFYQFCDFPWPNEIETTFPNQTQVLSYIKSYAKHFDLVKHIRFNTKVVSIKYNGPSEAEIESWAFWGGNGDPFGNNKSTWSITIEDLGAHSIEAIQVDFVILCVGKYSDIPNMPKFEEGKGPEMFQGKVMHSMEYANMENDKARNLVKGKQVTLVGFKKSALDIATEYSTTNGIENPCTIICRTAHWNPSDYSIWGIPLAYLYLNRFAELMVHKPAQGPWLDAIAHLLSPLRWVITKFVEIDIKNKHPLEKFNMVPEHRFNSCLISSIDKGFYDNVEKGSLILKRSSSFHFCKEGVRLDDDVGFKNPIVKSDLVILATGFKGDQKLKHIFTSTKFQKIIIGSPDNVVPLYRQCINPRIPQIAIIGFSENVSKLSTFEMTARWLMELLDGKFKLPSIYKMENDISEWDKFMKKYYGGKYCRRSCISDVQIWYNDQLCKDMGLNPMRKNGVWAELFEPYSPMDYVVNE